MTAAPDVTESIRVYSAPAHSISLVVRHTQFKEHWYNISGIFEGSEAASEMERLVRSCHGVRTCDPKMEMTRPEKRVGVHVLYCLCLRCTNSSFLLCDQNVGF